MTIYIIFPYIRILFELFLFQAEKELMRQLIEIAKSHLKWYLQSLSLPSSTQQTPLQDANIANKIALVERGCACFWEIWCVCTGQPAHLH